MKSLRKKTIATLLTAIFMISTITGVIQVLAVEPVEVIGKAEGHFLTVNIEPTDGGFVDWTPAPDPELGYDSGTAVTLTATPESGWEFVGWTGVDAFYDEYALSFDGIDDYVTVLDSEILDITDAITVEAWINPALEEASGDFRNVVGRQRQGSVEGGYALFATPGPYFGGEASEVMVLFMVDTTGDAFVGDFVEPDNWYHVVGTFDVAVGELKFYVNGELKEAVDKTMPGYSCLGNPITSIDRNLYIGGDPEDNSVATNEFEGAIDEVRIYNKAITAEEVTAHYNLGVGQYGEAEAELVAGYHFDEGTGDSTVDYSGLGNDGTFTGDVSFVPSYIGSQGLKGNPAVVVMTGDRTVTADFFLPKVSISVLPSSVELQGKIGIATPNIETVTVTNEGNVNVDVSAKLEGDNAAFFEAHLMIDTSTVGWPYYVAELDPGTPGEFIELGLGLDLAGITETGTYSATLVFWAELPT